MYGTPCPDDGEKRCYIRYSTNRQASSGPGTVFVYCPYGSKSRSKNQLLLSRSFDSESGKVNVFVPRTEADLGELTADMVVDTRILNEKGFYTGRRSDGGMELVHLSNIDANYLIGKALCEKMSEQGGRFMVTSFYPMGDNYRWLAVMDGHDYSDLSMVVTESAKDLPSMAGLKGFAISRGDHKCLRTYLSMNYHEDSRFSMIPYRPLYPGFMFHGDLDTSMFTGVARRSQEPALSLVEIPEDTDRRIRRKRLSGPRSILLNPYGFSIDVRSVEEKSNTSKVMVELSKVFQGRGYEVYTNTPFPDQEELPGTKRYEGDIATLMNGASGFDLVVTVFTGFMEVVMYSGCNLVVLNYSDDNSREHMAEGLDRDNYWEINVVENKPDVVVSRITEVFDGLPISKTIEYPGPARRPLSLEDKAALFEGQAVTTRLMRSVLHSTGKGELRELVEKGTDDPLLCCVGAKSLESGYQMDVDVVKAIQWYRKAYKLGVPWAKKKVVDLKGRL